jgi:Tat protein secretion system quality control protein TatD with DNase activity
VARALAQSYFNAMQQYGIIDCHAHIHEGNYPSNTSNSLQAILQNAREANVMTIVSVSENLKDAPQVLQLAAQSDGLILAGVGLHPVQSTSLDNESVERSVTMDDLREFLPFLQKCIENRQICCVGEGILRD